MKIKASHYTSKAGGLSLQLVPETPVEEAILKGFWDHGELRPEVGTGFYISWNFRQETSDPSTDCAADKSAAKEKQG